MSFRAVFEKREIRNLKDWAKQVWMLSDLNDKKLIAKDMVDNFEFKSKSDEFKTKIDKCNSGDRLDKLVGDIVLAGEGLAVKR